MVDVRRNVALSATVVVAVLVVDQLSKLWIIARFPNINDFARVTDFFDLVRVANRGVSFGLFNNDHTPRKAATSSRVRNCMRPSRVAFTRFVGLVLPWVLVRMLRMPQASRTSRTPGPALTPVPGPAGTRMTRLAPKRPMTRCGMVPPLRVILFICLWASLTPFSTAGGTSFALP